MAHVTLIGNLRQFTGGVTELDVEAANVRQLFAGSARNIPTSLPHLETGSAVAIDGQIYQDALLQEIGPDSDVHILPQIAGGSSLGLRGPDLTRSTRSRPRGPVRSLADAAAVIAAETTWQSGLVLRIALIYLRASCSLTYVRRAAARRRATLPE